jgi:hypothetical protein
MERLNRLLDRDIEISAPLLIGALGVFALGFWRGPYVLGSFLCR